ncbi:hypothetical protein [Nocardia callitridis]|uniref:hypothetical protein n=1 Tax=Nocardia callitridis TaxID=648753 RepID=UPI0031EC4FA4
MIDGEGCDDITGILDVEQAQGILRIHRHCTPPCRRRQAASEFLRGRGAPPLTAVQP